MTWDPDGPRNSRRDELFVLLLAMIEGQLMHGVNPKEAANDAIIASRSVIMFLDEKAPNE